MNLGTLLPTTALDSEASTLMDRIAFLRSEAQLQGKVFALELDIDQNRHRIIMPPEDRILSEQAESREIPLGWTPLDDDVRFLSHELSGSTAVTQGRSRILIDAQGLHSGPVPDPDAAARQEPADGLDDPDLRPEPAQRPVPQRERRGAQARTRRAARLLMSDRHGNSAGGQRGFTLLEAAVAMALLALVVTHFLGLRSAALIDAAEARDWRIARELAEQKLSQLQAGAHEFPPESGSEHEVEQYPDFRYRVLIGETAIGHAEEEIAEMQSGGEEEGSAADRRSWQQERERMRRAQASGMTMFEYEDRLLEEEYEVRAPSESEFEEVAVMVSFPSRRSSDRQDTPLEYLLLRARISTMAIEGLTPERASEMASLYQDSGGLQAGDEEGE